MPGSGSSSMGQVRDASQAAVRIGGVTVCWGSALGPGNPVSPAHAKLLSDVLSSHLYSGSSSLLVAGPPAPMRDLDRSGEIIVQGHSFCFCSGK